MPVLEGTAPYTGGESWQLKFSESAVTPEDTAAPYNAWHRTWHLHPGLAATGQFETTAPVPSSVLLARPWDAPVLRTEAASGPVGWRAGLEGVTSVSDEPWPFEVDARNGKLKCLACCASASGECNLDTCALKPPPLTQQFLDASRPGEDLRDPALVAAHVAYAQEQAKLGRCVRANTQARALTPTDGSGAMPFRLCTPHADATPDVHPLCAGGEAKPPSTGRVRQEHNTPSGGRRRTGRTPQLTVNLSIVHAHESTTHDALGARGGGSFAYRPNGDGRAPVGLAAQVLPAAVPSHSSAKSSERNLTFPVSALFSHPTQLEGKAQVPSVTVRLRAKLAPLVARRCLSCSPLLAALLASKSSVRLACAGAACSRTAADRASRPPSA